MILGVTVYPLTPDPNDNLRAYMRERETYSFADVQVFGKYPDYLLRYFEKNGIDADITPADLEVIKNTVDFVSFSYYSSICETTHEDMSEKTGGNLSRGYKNPYLSATEWGWQIDPVGLQNNAEQAVRQIPPAAVHCGKRNRRGGHSHIRKRGIHCRRRLQNKLPLGAFETAGACARRRRERFRLYNVGAHRPCVRLNCRDEKEIRHCLCRQAERRHRLAQEIPQKIVLLDEADACVNEIKKCAVSKNSCSALYFILEFRFCLRRHTKPEPLSRVLHMSDECRPRQHSPLFRSRLRIF